MPLLKRWPDAIVALVLWGICLAILLRTLVPTLYTLDSAEFVLGAQTLGIVHAPGYPLYLVLLHIFLQLPFLEATYAANLFSALTLSLVAPLGYGVLQIWLRDWRIAAITVLLLLWSYHIWLIGLFAEVYAPQLASLTVVGLLLMRYWRMPHRHLPYSIGIAFGLALALNPSSIFFAPALAVTFRTLRISWRASIIAAFLAILAFALPMLYLPLRFAANPSLNLAGMYDSQGVFQAVDLTTPAGLLWMLSGRQFGSLFFAEGILPTPSQLLNVMMLMLRNYLGIPFLIAIYGLIALFRQQRGFAQLWLVWFLPYTYFYTTYGAGDKDMMFGSSLLLCAFPLAYGLHCLFNRINSAWLHVACAALPILLFIIHFPLLDLSQEWEVRTRSEAALAVVPADAYVFGIWQDIVPMEYLHYVEGLRPDLTLYNLFLIEQQNLESYVNRLMSAGQTVIFVATRPETGSLNSRRWTPILQSYAVEIQVIPGTSPEGIPMELYRLRPSS
jgi:hypothetical protein